MKMTKVQVVREFEEYVLPLVVEQFERDGIRDIPARREAWNNYVDHLYRKGYVTGYQADNWVHPACCNR